MNDRLTASGVKQPKRLRSCREISPASGTERRSLTVWAGMIRQVWFRGADSTLELARLMSHARASLPYGGWSQLWKTGKMPFSKRKGEKLVAIGQGLEV